MKRTNLFSSIIILLLVAVIGYLLYTRYVPGVTAQSTEEMQVTPAAVEDSRVISAEAKVVPAQYAELTFPQAGRVDEIMVAVGEAVKAGQVLMRLDTATLQANLNQAEAGVAAAQASLQLVQAQFDQVRQTAHAKEAQTRAADWKDSKPSELDQPLWYFERSQQIAAAQTELATAQKSLETEQENLQSVLQKASSADLLAAEKRLAEARIAFLVASDVQDQTSGASGNDLRDQAQSTYDSAKNELDAAQAAYTKILSTQAADDVLEARARLSVAQEVYDTAWDRLQKLQTGDASPEVKSAQKAVEQAQAALDQAQAAQAAAQAALDQATLKAPIDGVVVDLNIKKGEIATPGMVELVLADLSRWQVETTDLAETDVVTLTPGMKATLKLDAFPGRQFAAVIQKIDMRGEDKRGDVNYTITLDFNPGEAAVRWGMTANVVFPR